MDFNECRTFTIGQFAALHGINKKTLMWYDEIGLLKPAFIKDNGYRCYTFQQSDELETILILRDLQVPLAEIRDFMARRSAASLQAMLTEKLAEVAARIASLQDLQKIMTRRREEMRRLCALDIDAITLIYKEAQPLVLVPTGAQVSFSEEIERVLKALKTLAVKRMYDASYGAMLPVAAINAGAYDAYSALTIALPGLSSADGLHIQPAGWYLRAYHQGAWDGLPERYRALCAYAEQEGLVFVGHAYERGLNDAVITCEADSITEIEIPVQRAKELPLPISQDEQRQLS